MDATLLSFRGGRRTRKTNQFLLAVEGVETREKATGYIGRKVVWLSPVKAPDRRPKQILGTITHHHGNKGVLRVRFPKGLPGEAVREKVKVLD